MPRRHSITNMIREGLRTGISQDILLRRAHEMSPNPDAWTRDSIARIARDIGPRRPRDPVSFETHPGRRNETETAIREALRQVSPQPTAQPIQVPPSSVSGLIRYLLRNNEPHDNILARARALARTRGGNPEAWTQLSIERIARELRLTATRTAVESRESTSAASVEGIDDNATYGIEIEFLIPETSSRQQVIEKLEAAGIPARDESYNHNVRSWWKLTTDSSVRAGGEDRETDANGYLGGNELVSPILKGADGLEKIRKVCHVLASMKCKVNRTCGLHVHHGVKWERIQLVKFFKNAFLIYLKYQNKLKAMVPKSRHNYRYCHSVNTNVVQYFRGPVEMSRAQNEFSRYLALNLQSFWKHGTLEFRLHSGSLDAEKIINWVIITQKMILKAKTFTENNEDVESYSFKKIHLEFNWSANLLAYYKIRVAKFSNSLVEELA